MTVLHCDQCGTSTKVPCSCANPHYVPHAEMLARRREITLRLHAAGMTQQAIASRLGVSQQLISHDLASALPTIGNAGAGRTRVDKLGRPNLGRPRAPTPAPRPVAAPPPPVTPMRSSPPATTTPTPPPPTSSSRALVRREPTLEQRIAKLEKLYAQILKVRRDGCMPREFCRSMNALLHQPQNVSEAKLHELRVQWDVYVWLLASEKTLPTPSLTDAGIPVVKPKEKVR